MTAITVADVGEQLAAAQARLAELKRARRPHVLKAAQDNAAAKQKLAELTAEQSTLGQEIEDLQAAHAEAETIEAAEREQRAAVASQAALNRARELAKTYLAEAATFDRLLAELAASHGRYKKLAGQIRETRCLPELVMDRVGDQARIDIAIRHHGVNLLYAGNRSATRSDCPTLVEMDTATLQHLDLPTVGRR